MTDLLAAPRAALATALGRATAARGARVFHPRGQAYAGCLRVSDGGGWGARVLDEPGEHAVTVRLSRGAGLPHPLPDVDGLAVRLPGRGVGGAPLDLLVNSAWRFVFAPSVLSPTWSCVLPYDTASGRRLLIGARPVDGGFTMLAAPLLGAWRPWARLELGAPCAGEQLRFVPTVGADDLQPVELFRRLRGQAYVQSQKHRA